MPQSVAIIGAGPSGLVAAKTLLQWPTSPPYEVTIFEKSHSAGGMWPGEPSRSHTSPSSPRDHPWEGRKQYCSPEMPLNTSRFSATFSDLAWENVDLSPDHTGQYGRDWKQSGLRVPMFPKAWQAGRYLEQYRRTYIPETALRFGCEVIGAEVIERDGGKKVWKLRIVRAGAESGVKRAEWSMSFDRLIVASGFLSRTQTVSENLLGLRNKDVDPESMPRILHSSELRDLTQLVKEPGGGFRGEKILVVGGANSGGDAAATLAFQICSALHSPARHTDVSEPLRKSLSDLKVYHLFPRPLYAVPEFNARPYDGGRSAEVSNGNNGETHDATDESAAEDVTQAKYHDRVEDTEGRANEDNMGDSNKEVSEGIESHRNHHLAPFLPLDVLFWDLSSRPAGPITCFGGRQSLEAMKMLHSAAQAAVGGDQSELGAPELVASEVDGAMHATLTDGYSEFIRSKVIIPVKGRLSDLHVDKVSGNTMTASLVDGRNLKDIAAIVDATGFSASKTLSIFSANVLEALEYDSSSQRLPLILTNFQTSSPAVPSLAFMGFYEGTYWGMLEMQARMIAHSWSDSLNNPSPHGSKRIRLTKFSDWETLDKMRELRTAIRSRALDVPQYWIGDFAGYMEGIAQDLGLPRMDHGLYTARSADGTLKGTATPARYMSPSRLNIDPSEREARMTLTALDETVTLPKTFEAYTSQAVLRALQGNWDVLRIVRDTKEVVPVRRFPGIAIFYSRMPTARQYDRESLLVEKFSNGPEDGAGKPTMKEHRQVWRYCEGVLGTTSRMTAHDPWSHSLSIWGVEPNGDGLTADEWQQRSFDNGSDSDDDKKYWLDVAGVSEEFTGLRCLSGYYRIWDGNKAVGTIAYFWWFRAVSIIAWGSLKKGVEPDGPWSMTYYSRPQGPIFPWQKD